MSLLCLQFLNVNRKCSKSHKLESLSNDNKNLLKRTMIDHAHDRMPIYEKITLENQFDLRQMKIFS